MSNMFSLLSQFGFNQPRRGIPEWWMNGGMQSPGPSGGQSPGGGMAWAGGSPNFNESTGERYLPGDPRYRDPTTGAYPYRDQQPGGSQPSGFPRMEPGIGRRNDLLGFGPQGQQGFGQQGFGQQGPFGFMNRFKGGGQF